MITVPVVHVVVPVNSSTAAFQSMTYKVYEPLQVELLCNMVVSDEKQDRVDKDSARSFVLTCLRSGVRLDLKPKKSADGLVAHASAAQRQTWCAFSYLLSGHVGRPSC